jgi:hypothetical protein
VPPVLVVARLGQAPRQRQDQRERVLAHRVGVDAGGGGEADAARREGRLVELVGARADRLDELQPGRAVEQVVAPQAGDHQHVGLADAGVEPGAVAHLERTQAALAQREALLHLVGDMGEADRGLGGRGEHGYWTLRPAWRSSGRTVSMK